MAQKLLINSKHIKGGSYENNVSVLLTIHRIFTTDCRYYPFYFSVIVKRVPQMRGSLYFLGDTATLRNWWISAKAGRWLYDLY